VVVERRAVNARRAVVESIVWCVIMLCGNGVDEEESVRRRVTLWMGSGGA
jgi:hypothetical protein